MFTARSKFRFSDFGLVFLFNGSVPVGQYYISVAVSTISFSGIGHQSVGCLLTDTEGLIDCIMTNSVVGFYLLNLIDLSAELRFMLPVNPISSIFSQKLPDSRFLTMFSVDLKWLHTRLWRWSD